MTVEAIEAERTYLRYVTEEIRDKQEALCEDCEAVRVVYDPEDYWGAACRRPEVFCPIDFDVGAAGCHRGNEYEELEAALAAVLKDIRQLESLEVTVFTEEVA